MKNYHKKRCLFSVLLLTAAVALAGCGSGAKDTSGEEPVSAEPPAQTIDWDTYKMTTPQSAEDGPAWYLAEYHDDWATASSEEYDWMYSMDAAAPGGNICSRLLYSTGNVADGDYRAWNYLDYFDAQTGQSFHATFDPDSWGLPENSFLLDMDMAGEQLAVFLFRSHGETDSPLSFCTLVFYHLEKGVQKTLDLLPALGEAGITEETEPILDSTKKSVLCDPNGCCYLIWDDRLIVVDDTGKLLCYMGQEEESYLSYLCKTSIGFPIFTTRNKNDRTSSYWAFDPDAGEMRSLGKTPNMTLKYGCMDTSGYLYYLNGDKIVRWNTLTGEQENIFDCQAHNICSNTAANKVMAVRENGDLVIMDSITENRNIYVLSPVQPEKTRTLTLVSTCYGNQLEQSAVALFSMKNPDVNIEFSSVESSGASGWEETQAYKNKLINRIIAGDAPDMFIISAEDMQILYDKGALADLTDIIPPQTREQVFDCIWNAGTIDGRLIGLTNNMSVSGILVSDEIWSRDTWTLEDILALAEAAPKDTLKGLIPLSGLRPLASDVLYWLALRNIDSSLVDRETGTCHFDSEIFRRLLEYCKNTPIPEPNSDLQNPAPARAVIDGEYLAYACTIYDFADFSYQMSLFPENYHWVGVPTRDRSGNLIYAGIFLVVSKDTENMDLIKEFLPLLYDADLQCQLPWKCLRQDILRERVFVPDWDSSAHFDMGEGSYMILEAKPDGTSYAEDYITFLNSCVPSPVGDRTIETIVLEEVEPYFTGDKDIDKVIEIIQNRVQLYLDENGS